MFDIARPFSTKKDVALVVSMLASIYHTHGTLPHDLVSAVIVNLSKAPEFARMLFYNLLWKNCKPALLKYFSGPLHELLKPNYEPPSDEQIVVVKIDKKEIDEVLALKDLL